MLSVARALLLLASLAPGVPYSDSETAASEVLLWALANGATFDPRQQVRRRNASDAASVRGVFALRPIEPGAILLTVPWSIAVTTADEYAASVDVRCSSVAAIRAYLAQRPLQPYQRLLLESVPDLPFAWPLEAQKHLGALLGDSLPPLELGRRHEAWFKRCEEVDLGDALGTTALHLAIARAAAIRNWTSSSPADENKTWLTLLPLYDLYNHRNGGWHNTRVVGSVGKPLQIFAHRHIRKGEELYLSYGWGADHMFDAYGFVEDLPQRWSFHLPDDSGRPVSFDLDAPALEAPGDSPRHDRVVWRSDTPSKAQRQRMSSELEGLRARMKAIEADGALIHNLAWRYAEATERALSSALHSANTHATMFSFVRAFNLILCAAILWKIVSLAQNRAKKEHTE
eukprot:CAMPEP_0172592032 /NCGR_PEP_ID=MMETSP1068-20121228/10929_1 /TAXON_ID=35684 /ORGANISM="Pseudopedinella elastica, Strain CCMP716" /LENGTH=399 /DNA_ID=CAMNT_0013388819 /DNA_START=76 /DNA_END=1275 /DNA_ORIENTATION=-